LKRTEVEIDTPVDLPYSQSELASIVGVSRQTINQLLHTLAEKGLIQVGFKRVRVLGPQKLLASL
jgi:DNA-binding transcriptional regulator LsrR (DeoR family)